MVESHHEYWKGIADEYEEATSHAHDIAYGRHGITVRDPRGIPEEFFEVVKRENLFVGFFDGGSGLSIRTQEIVPR